MYFRSHFPALTKSRLRLGRQRGRDIPNVTLPTCIFVHDCPNYRHQWPRRTVSRQNAESGVQHSGVSLRQSCSFGRQVERRSRRPAT